MKLFFVHIIGSKKGHTEVFEKDNIRIGTQTSCDIRFNETIDKGVSELHAEITCIDGSYVLNDLGSRAGTFVNKKLVDRVNLHDGDLVCFGADGPEICVRLVGEKKWPVPGELKGIENGIIKGLYEAAITFNSLLKNIIPQQFIKYPYMVNLFIFSIFMLAIVGLLTFFYLYLYELKKTTKRVQVLETERSVVENIIEKYRRGVCLIQGSYYLIDKKTGKPMWGSQDGMPIASNFTGTGFLVGPEGIILTNRHIAEPIWFRNQIPSDKFDADLQQPEMETRFVVLRAFFPEVRAPFSLEVDKISDEADVATLKFEPGGQKLPVLSLDMSQKEVRIGEPVILLGYPAGINAIFAKAEQKLVEELVNLPFLQIAEELSNRNLIRPLITQGHVSDMTIDKIIYDAQTTVGGSGGPLINREGKVIGVNYGILREFRGSNFAVPIKYGVKLLGDQGLTP